MCMLSACMYMRDIVTCTHTNTHITHTTHAHIHAYIHAHIHTTYTRHAHIHTHKHTQYTYKHTDNTHTQILIHIPGVICDKYNFMVYSVNQNTLLNCNVM